MIFDKLKQFRQSAYMLLGQAKDAVCDLIDACFNNPKVKSFVELSLSPVFRRKCEAYAALTDGRPQRRKLMKLYIAQMSMEAERPLLAGDHTAWPRPEARTLRDRTIINQQLSAAINH